MTTQPDLTPHFAHVSDDPLSNAFDDARQAHPPSGQVPVAPDARAAAWQTCLDTPRKAHSMAYVHVPFCENHCLFCGFYQNPWRPEQGAPYVDLVLKQASMFADKPVLQGPPLRALYFGGGTPTALGAQDISRLVTGLRERLPLAPDCEITLEGRIFSFTEDKMEAAFAAGVNRVSLGVQTFDTKIRRSLGRKRTREEVIASLERLVAFDSGAIVLDLMYGLPGQSHETWANDLAMVDALGLDGVDLYGLNMIPGTPLMSSVEKGKLTPLTRRELGSYYAQGAEVMAQLGWEQISASHWRSQSYRERSVYNFGAKTGWDFFGLGAGAGGKLNGFGTFNTPMLDVYDKQVSSGEAPLMGLSRASRIKPLVDAVTAGMERGRIDTAAIATAQDRSGLTAPPALDTLTRLFDQWQEAGLLSRRHRFYNLTLAGKFWQVQMTKRVTALLSEMYLPPEENTSMAHAVGPGNRGDKKMPGGHPGGHPGGGHPGGHPGGGHPGGHPGGGHPGGHPGARPAPHADEATDAHPGKKPASRPHSAS